MASKRNSTSRLSLRGRRMSAYITDAIFETKVFNAFTLVDYRTLTQPERNAYQEILHEALLTTIPEVLCGGPETERLALKMFMGERDVSEAEVINFLAQYRAATNRTTPAQFTGQGIVRFALYSGSNLIGSVLVTSASITARNGNIIEVKLTPSILRTGVNVFNAARTRVTAAWTQDQALLFRYMLNNTFGVADSSIAVKPTLIDPHPRNTLFAALQATIDYDADLAAIMATYIEITTVQGFEGARAYNLYKHI